MRAFFFVFMLATSVTTYTQPTQIQVAQNSGSGTGAVTLTLPQTPTVNDLLLCRASQTAGSGVSITWPSGFTVIGSQQNAGTSLGIAQAYRVVQVGDGTSYSVTPSATVGGLVFGCSEYAYINTTTPIMSSACSTDNAPGTLENGPSLTATMPTVGSSIFAAVTNSNNILQPNFTTDYDAVSGGMQVHDQRSAPIYNFQTAFAAALGYNWAPSKVVVCSVLFNPVITPFTETVVTPAPTTAPTATPTPVPTATPSPTPTPGPTATPTASPTPVPISLQHVQTAIYGYGYGGVSTTVPISYQSQYVTYAYTQESSAVAYRAAGMKVIVYSNYWRCYTSDNPLICYTELKPGGTRAAAEAKDCSGAVITDPTYGGGYQNDPRNTTASEGLASDVVNYRAVTEYVGAYDNVFADDSGTVYGLSATPCGYTASSWISAMNTVHASLSSFKPLFLNGGAAGTITGATASQQAQLASPGNVAGIQCENCFIDSSNRLVSGASWVYQQNEAIAVMNAGKIWWDYNNGNSSTTLAQRQYAHASFLLTYQGASSLLQMHLPSASGFLIFPESLLVATAPQTTATSSVSEYQVSGGAYVRVFNSCYYQGVAIGQCASVVNPGSTSISLPSLPFSNSFITSGAGILDGGTGSLSGPKVTSLAPFSGAVLVNAAPTTTGYTYRGCQVYPASDPYANDDISSATPATNSASIVSAWSAEGNFDYGDTAVAEAVNLATNSTPLFTVGTVGGGHSPPLGNGPGTQVPWVNGYYIEGTLGMGGDAHSEVLNTDTCSEAEMYGTHWTSPSGPLAAYSGDVLNLNASLSSQFGVLGGSTVAKIPILGFTDFGEDAALTSINHPLSFFSPTAASIISEHGYYYPSQTGYEFTGTCTTGTACLHLGDYIRLKSTFDCSPYTRVGQLVCNQLKHYGAVYDDNASGLGFRFGLSTDGSNPWNYTTNLKPLFQALTFANFDIIEQGTLHCTGTPCV